MLLGGNRLPYPLSLMVYLTPERGTPIFHQNDRLGCTFDNLDGLGHFIFGLGVTEKHSRGWKPHPMVRQGLRFFVDQWLTFSFLFMSYWCFRVYSLFNLRCDFNCKIVSVFHPFLFLFFFHLFSFLFASFFLVFLAFVIYYAVTEGLCGDPLNKNAVYFFGDIFRCEQGMELDNETTIQCVMDVSMNRVDWNETRIPKCKGKIVQLYIGLFRQSKATPKEDKHIFSNKYNNSPA